jgi:hypothetical protein
VQVQNDLQPGAVRPADQRPQPCQLVPVKGGAQLRLDPLPAERDADDLDTAAGQIVEGLLAVVVVVAVVDPGSGVGEGARRVHGRRPELSPGDVHPAQHLASGPVPLDHARLGVRPVHPVAAAAGAVHGQLVVAPPLAHRPGGHRQPGGVGGFVPGLPEPVPFGGLTSAVVRPTDLADDTVDMVGREPVGKGVELSSGSATQGVAPGVLPGPGLLPYLRLPAQQDPAGRHQGKAEQQGCEQGQATRTAVTHRAAAFIRARAVS